jgi:hypothetical protein
MANFLRATAARPSRGKTVGALQANHQANHHHIHQYVQNRLLMVVDPPSISVPPIFSPGPPSRSQPSALPPAIGGGKAAICMTRSYSTVNSECQTIAGNAKKLKGSPKGSPKAPQKWSHGRRREDHQAAAGAFKGGELPTHLFPPLEPNYLLEGEEIFKTKHVSAVSLHRPVDLTPVERGFQRIGCSCSVLLSNGSSYSYGSGGSGGGGDGGSRSGANGGSGIGENGGRGRTSNPKVKPASRNLLVRIEPGQLGWGENGRIWVRYDEYMKRI